MDLKLIDQLGDEKAAVAWLVAEKKRSRATSPVRDFKLTPKFSDFTFLHALLPTITLDAVGLNAIARQVEQAGLAQAMDRLRSRWHAGAVAAGHAPTTELLVLAFRTARKAATTVSWHLSRIFEGARNFI